MPGDGGLNYDTFYWVDIEDPADNKINCSYRKKLCTTNTALVKSKNNIIVRREW